MFTESSRRQLLGGLLGLVGMVLGRRAVGPAPPPAPRTPPGGRVAYRYTTSDGDLVTAYAYDGGGLASVRPAPLGEVTTYTYDGNNRLVPGVGRACAPARTYSYDWQAGRWVCRG